MGGSRLTPEPMQEVNVGNMHVSKQTQLCNTCYLEDIVSVCS